MQYWFYEHLCLMRPPKCTISPLEIPWAARWTDDWKQKGFPGVALHDLREMRNFISNVKQDCIMYFPWSLDVIKPDEIQLLVQRKAKTSIPFSCGRMHIMYMGDRFAHQEESRWIISRGDKMRMQLSHLNDTEVGLWNLRGGIYYTEVCVEVTKLLYSKYWKTVTKTDSNGVIWNMTIYDGPESTLTINFPPTPEDQHTKIPPYGKLPYSELYSFCQDLADVNTMTRRVALLQTKELVSRSPEKQSGFRSEPSEVTEFNSPSVTQPGFSQPIPQETALADD